MRTAPERIAIAAGVVAVAVAAFLPATGQGLQRSVASVVSPPLVGSKQYVARPDPRLCPSPLCGGYWVALANRSRTRCTDGAFRPRCYVAVAVDVDRHPLETGIPDGALVRADLEPWKFQGFGDLGAVVVADVRPPLGKGTKGIYYRVRDLGIRCIRAPCFSFRAAQLNRSSRVTFSSLDLAGAEPAPKERARAEQALATANGLFVLGRIVKTSDAGRILKVARIYLNSE